MSAQNSRQATLAVIGEATVSVPPDRLVLVLGVQSVGTTASQALAENNLKMQRVGEALRRLGLGTDQMQTTGLNLISSHRTSGQGENSTTPGMAASQVWQTGDAGQLISITGHNALSWIKLSLQDGRQLGEILDMVLLAGANLIHSVTLTFQDEPTIRRKALEAAGKDAVVKAKVLAKAMNRELGSLVSIAEEFVTSQALDGLTSVTKPGVHPVSPGELPISARVRAIYDLS